MSCSQWYVLLQTWRVMEWKCQGGQSEQRERQEVHPSAAFHIMAHFGSQSRSDLVPGHKACKATGCKRSNPSQLQGTHLAISHKVLCSWIVSLVERGSEGRTQCISYKDQVRTPTPHPKSQFTYLWNGRGWGQSQQIYAQATTRIKQNTILETIKGQTKAKGSGPLPAPHLCSWTMGVRRRHHPLFLCPSYHIITV